MVFQGGSTNVVTISLGSTPTPGNLIVIGGAGNDNGIKPAGFTTIFADSGTLNAALYASWKRAAIGDPAGPYQYTGFAGTFDYGFFIAEFAGAGNPSVWAEGNAAWTLAGTTEVSNGTVNTLAGSFIIELFNVNTGSTTIAQGADSVNESFNIVFHNGLSTSSTGKSYEVIATRSDATASTANPTATMPNVTTANSNQSQFGLVIPPGSSGGNQGVGSCWGNTNLPNTQLWPAWF